jgi:hypothetical protein
VTPIHVGVWLALLLNAGSEKATPAPTVGFGTVMGRIFSVARDTVAQREAFVRVVGGKGIGTESGNTGDYVLTGVPSGLRRPPIRAGASATGPSSAKGIARAIP